MQLEIIDSHSDSDLQDTFKSAFLPEFYLKSVGEKYPEINLIAAQILSMSVITYRCKQFYSSQR